VQIFNIAKYKNSNIIQSFYLSITQGFVALFLLIIDYFFAKHLSLEEFGRWKHLIFVLNLVIPIFSLGIAEGYKYFLAKENRKHEMFSKVLTIYLYITLVMLFIAIFLNFLQLLAIIDLGDYFLLSLFIPLVYFSFSINKILRYAYINERNINNHTRVTLISYLFFSIFLFLSIYYLKIIPIKFIYIGMFLYMGIFLAPIWFLLKRGDLYLQLMKPDKNYLKKVIQQGVPLYIATFIGTLSVNIGLFIVNLYGDKESFAIFAAGSIEIPIFAMLSASFSQRIYPELVRLVNIGNTGDAKKLWIKTTKQVSFITYPIIILMMIFAKTIILGVYDAKYINSIILFKTYLIIGIIRNNYYGAILTAQGKARYITLYSFFMLISNFIISIICYNFFGALGLVIGNLFSTFIINWLQLRHENMAFDYLTQVILDWKLLSMILLILIFYFVPIF